MDFPLARAQQQRLAFVRGRRLAGQREEPDRASRRGQGENEKTAALR
ncbi:MAG: hypothetical protein ACLPKE_10715 [Streptosporangiaceae bacterium]